MSEWATHDFPAADSAARALAQEMLDRGLIFLVNEAVLHRLGYALGVSVEDDKVTGLTLHTTDDPRGIWFDEETTEFGRSKLFDAGLLGDRVSYTPPRGATTKGGQA